MYTLYSQRIKDAQGEPETFVYDYFEQSFRNQFFAIINEMLGMINDDDIYSTRKEIILCEKFARERGLKCISGGLNYYDNSIAALECYIGDCSDEELLDLIDFTFGAFTSNPEIQKEYQYYISPKDIENAVDELNLRFKQHNLGYEFINHQIIKKTNTMTHENIVKPVLKLFAGDRDFEPAEEEYLQAFEHFKSSDNKDAILNAIKAFESTMKIICKKLGYPFDEGKDAAGKLLDILRKNNFYPEYLDNHMEGICITLKSGALTLRNKEAAHGQGAEVRDVSDEYAEYALNLVAVDILFLYRIYKKKESEGAER